MLPANWYWPVGMLLLLVAGAAWGWRGIREPGEGHVPSPDSGLVAAQEARQPQQGQGREENG